MIQCSSGVVERVSLCVCVSNSAVIYAWDFLLRKITLWIKTGGIFLCCKVAKIEKSSSPVVIYVVWKWGHETKKERDIALAPSGSNPFCFLHSTDRNGRNTFWRDRIFVCSMQTSSDIVARSTSPLCLARLCPKCKIWLGLQRGWGGGGVDWDQRQHDGVKRAMDWPGAEVRPLISFLSMQDRRFSSPSRNG